ncbi:Rieske (2Fe-2S) protein [Frankia sp. AgKG'84/4]|uniref:Rieske (2Fe-2S) protein n=1 Tax=Frankia sp. AgKG'84/4 TaxID=573490 RepID=UPI00200C4898|nr:Rieske (2Fe-2S) protein [Frankia sp. AgKG'84/4]MCL9793840.1 Rieske (2Fe-2S) protein [Frankia sp. AgKG'84/4]
MTTLNDLPASRRGVLSAAAVVGTGAGLALAGCSSSGSSDASAPASTSSDASSAPASAAATTAAGSSGTVLGATSQVPVGGGMIFSSEKVVVTQPTAGTFKAFSSTCTHQGCQVNAVADGQIKCPCHGSRFSATDGSVVGGPAPRPLPAANVSVQGTNLVLGT